MKEYPYDMSTMPPKWRKKYQKAGNKFLRAVMELDQARMEEMKQEPLERLTLFSPAPDLNSPVKKIQVWVAPRTGDHYYNGGHGEEVEIDAFATDTEPALVSWHPIHRAVAYDVWVGAWPWRARYFTTTTKCEIVIDSIPLVDQPIPEPLQLMSPSIPQLTGEENE